MEPETEFYITIKKHQIMEFLVEEWCHIHPIEFQTLVESMPRCTEAVLTDGGPMFYYDTLYWCFLYFGSYLTLMGEDGLIVMAETE